MRRKNLMHCDRCNVDQEHGVHSPRSPIVNSLSKF